MQIEAIEQLLEEYGVSREEVPAGAVVTIVAALSRAMAQDNALGVDEGYEEAIALVERILDGLARQQKSADTESGPN